MFGIGWDLLQPKGNIIAPIVFIPAKKKTPKIRGSFAMKRNQMSMLKAGIDVGRLVVFLPPTYPLLPHSQGGPTSYLPPTN